MSFDSNNRKLLCFYGDDFTGSTDTMEALAINGVSTVLFLQVPDKDLMESRFQDVQCIGVAGLSRTMNTKQMEEELKPILEQLQFFHPYILHYKTCSTFDSSPQIGSIGYVIDMGRELYAKQLPMPILVGAPPLKRFTVFGNHFAPIGEETYRLDRHPVMSKHPVTPMHEADLRLHLKHQTDATIDLVNVLDLEKDIQDIKAVLLEKTKLQPEAILFDILTEQHMEKIGEVLWDTVKNETVSSFFVGSSGIEYALTAIWKKLGMIEPPTYTDQKYAASQPILVVSGSCSPVTQAQLNYGLDHGFIGIKVSPTEITNQVYVHGVLEQACSYLNRGESVIIYTALGPDDPSIQSTKQYLEKLGHTAYNPGQFLGERLGKLTKEIVLNAHLKRIVVAGGDTSGFVTRELDIMALEMMIPIGPGAPLCKCYSQNLNFDGLELALKGGQLGQVDYLERVRMGDVSHYTRK